MNRFDDGVPVPAVKYGPKPKIDWDLMKVGQSVYVDDRKAGRSALLSAQKYAKTAYVSVWRMPDGTEIHPLENIPLKDLYQMLPEGGNWNVIGRKCFTGRQEHEGWRIWRVANQPLAGSDVVVVDGVKWISSSE